MQQSSCGVIWYGALQQVPAADSAFLAQASGFNLAVVAELVVDFF